MGKLIIGNGSLVTSFRVIKNGTLVLENGKIEKIILEGDHHPLLDAEYIDASGCYVSPGFIDIHVHGGGGGDVMDSTPEALRLMGNIHALHGTTSFVPTTEASSWELLYKALDNLIQNMEADIGPHILGVHLEGPYLSHEQTGAQDKDSIFEPDKKDYMRLLDYSENIIRVSLAPEIKGSEDFLYELKKRNIQASIAHTNSDFDQVIKAVESGCTSVTHLYSCMPGVRRVNAYRIAGAIEAALFLDELSVEVISDGCHLPPALLKLIYKCKGSDGIILVTDAIRAVGLPEGESYLVNSDSRQKIIIEDGVAKLPDRTAFAGSIATCDRLVRNMVKLAGVPLCEAVKMITYNPARLLGIEKRKGILSEGMDADITIFDEDICIKRTIINGKVYRSN